MSVNDAGTTIEVVAAGQPEEHIRATVAIHVAGAASAMIESVIGRAIESEAVRTVELIQCQTVRKPAAPPEHDVGAAASLLGFLSRDQEVVQTIAIEVADRIAVDPEQIAVRQAVDPEPSVGCKRRQCDRVLRHGVAGNEQE